ncbi:hypothetical protein EMCRGX_G025323 [Ephydatia muelleri]
MDDSVATLCLDNSSPVCDLVKDICKSIALHHQADEFSVTVDRDFPVYINPDIQSSYGKIHKQMDSLKRKLYTSPRCINQDVVLTLRRKFFISIDPIDIKDTPAVDLLYIQNKKYVISGALLCKYKEAIKLAGLQCQIVYGDHDPSKHKLGMLNLVGYLPHDCIQLKDAEKSVWAEHSTLRKMSELNAKLCYIRFCHSLPTYGTHFTLVREKAEEKSKLVPCLLGISKNGIIKVDHVKTRNVLTSWPLSYIKRWAFGSDVFILDFGDHRKKYVVQTDEPDLLVDLIGGYIDRAEMLNAERSAIKRPERITVTETVTDKTPALDLSKTKSDEITAANVYTPINRQLLTKTTEDEYVQIEKSINMGSAMVHEKAVEPSQLPKNEDDSCTGSDDEMVKGIFPQLPNASNLENQSAYGSYASFLEYAGLASVGSSGTNGLKWGHPSWSPYSLYSTPPRAESSMPSQRLSPCGSPHMGQACLDSQTLVESLLGVQAELQKTRQMLAFAEQRAIVAEQRATLAEQRAILSEQRAVFAEQKQQSRMIANRLDRLRQNVQAL